MKAVNWIIFIAVVAVIVVFSAFVDKFGIGYWDKVEEWAQTGDFFGGILNPIFAFLSLILIAYTLMQNKKALEQSKVALEQSKDALKQNESALEVGNEELKLSRIEFSKSVEALESQVDQFNFQRFENTFFNMLTLQNEILNTVVFNSTSISPLKNPKNESSTSRAAFSSILRWIDGEDENEDEQFATLSNYDLFQVQANQVVGHYYRNLYQIIKFIDDSGLCDDDKEKYARILRAQLSSDEIAVLFFNCLSPKVDSGQFKSFVITYKMLEHLTVDPFFHIGYARISTQLVYVPESFFEQYVVRGTGDNIIESAFGTNQALKKFAIQIQKI
ncbi:Phage abortive infection protein [Vibrio crassostreae]|uniref:putative phage abortive infection protein n=1 Tax=Vibrio crassostreae TaxID=246167 RepID=UPI0005E2C70E|nr:putative phage abortive infection protein [Vibrio crassostreae]TCT62894.1 putative phage abortive infection protein [Vibrio crassostreae]TCT83904.1 putative phage abortive infection protein [Vibrio crassostreae]TCU02120.1 putative phage abortive infection protein [Vibrio crassostreae]TDW10029.1 putative phage abortive infection protein [Vibrio crassostreae]CAK1803463.1 Phage abortive infection protein [Vibrio crassostreae]